MSKTKNFIFKGKQSFSSSKLDQIKRQFSNSNQIDAKISSNEIYLVQSKSEKINHEGLQDILAAKENDAKFTFYVGPRLGTISPWSSKTEDIIRTLVSIISKELKDYMDLILNVILKLMHLISRCSTIE